MTLSEILMLDPDDAVNYVAAFLSFPFLLPHVFLYFLTLSSSLFLARLFSFWLIDLNQISACSILETGGSGMVDTHCPEV